MELYPPLNTLNYFENQYRKFLLRKNSKVGKEHLSKECLVNASMYLIINIDYLTAGLPDAEMAKALLALIQQTRKSLL